MFATKYERRFAGAKLAAAPLDPAMWVFLIALMSPLTLTNAVLGTSQTGVALLVLQFGCSMILMELDEDLACWRFWDASGERVRPLVEFVSGAWRDRVRPLLVRTHKRWTRPLWYAVLGIPLLGLAQGAGLVTGRPELTAGVGLSESGVVVLWLGACALMLVWWILRPLTKAPGADLDLPELKPRHRTSEIAGRLPSSWLVGLRAMYFVGLPLVALCTTL